MIEMNKGDAEQLYGEDKRRRRRSQQNFGAEGSFLTKFGPGVAGSCGASCRRR